MSAKGFLTYAIKLNKEYCFINVHPILIIIIGTCFYGKIGVERDRNGIDECLVTIVQKSCSCRHNHIRYR